MRWLIHVILALALVAGCGRQEASPRAAAPSGGSTAAAAGLVTYPRFEDAKPHRWTGRAPDSYPIHGIDVSRYQGAIDWARARDAGVSFAFLKATEGGDRLDPKFKEFWRGAKQAGVPRGAYHFYYFCRPAIEQARWFVSHVPKERGALPPVLDMEWNPQSPSCKLRPPAHTVRREMKVFLNFVRRHYRQTPVVYTTPDFYRDNELSKIEDVSFWLRSVADHPDQTYPGQEWTFWQYTGTGKMSGVEGDTDINAFRGDRYAWKEWLEAVTK